MSEEEYAGKVRTMFLVAIILLGTCFPILAAETIDWQTMTFRDINIHYHRRDERIVRELSKQIVHDIDNFQKSISFYPVITTKIIIAPDDGYYSDLVSGYSGVVEFSEAFYSGRERTIYIKNPRHLQDYGSLRRIVLHEYIHLFIDSLLNDAPLWFHEGMAVYFSEGISFDREISFAREFLTGNSKPLAEMTRNYPPNRVQWQPFYTKSALAVRYLYSRHKEEFYRFWELTGTNGSFSPIFLDSFAMTQPMFSAYFDDYLSRKYKIEMLLSITGIIWAVLPLFLLIAWLKKKIVAYRIQRRWNKEILEQHRKTPDIKVTVDNDS